EQILAPVCVDPAAAIAYGWPLPAGQRGRDALDAVAKPAQLVDAADDLRGVFLHLVLSILHFQPGRTVPHHRAASLARPVLGLPPGIPAPMGFHLAFLVGTGEHNQRLD